MNFCSQKANFPSTIGDTKSIQLYGPDFAIYHIVNKYNLFKDMIENLPSIDFWVPPVGWAKQHKDAQLFSVLDSSPEWNVVINNFKKTSPNFLIKEVQRIQNKKSPLNFN